MSAPPFVVAFVGESIQRLAHDEETNHNNLSVSMITAVIADRYSCRGFMIIFFTLCNVIGFVMFYGACCALLVLTNCLMFCSEHVKSCSLRISLPDHHRLLL